MGLFIIASILVILVVAALLRPFFAETNNSYTPSPESQLYQDQLDEIARDQSRGVLSADQAATARQEIERRLLGALRRDDQPQHSSDRSLKMGAVIVVAALPILAGVMYLQLGHPGMSDQPFHDRQSRAINAPAGADDFQEQITALREHLATSPDDLEGYTLLARSYASVGAYSEALDAYATSNRLAKGQDPKLAAEYAEVMVVANRGIVTDTAASIFAQLLQNIPGDPQAIYYLALQKYQRGNPDGAREDLNALRAASAPDAPWLVTVDRLLANIESAAPDRPGPTAEQLAAAADMTPEQQAAMAVGMVTRLAQRLDQNPDDIDGWRRLARAYEVLGQNDHAAQAHARVIERVPNDPVAKAFLDRYDAATATPE